MKSVLRYAGQALAQALTFGAITLALDFILTAVLFPGLKKSWAEARGVRCIDGFAPFFREPADVAIGKYFIPGDVHFTEAGNRLLYDTVRTAVGDDW